MFADEICITQCFEEDQQLSSLEFRSRRLRRSATLISGTGSHAVRTGVTAVWQGVTYLDARQEFPHTQRIRRYWRVSDSTGTRTHPMNCPVEAFHVSTS